MSSSTDSPTTILLAILFGVVGTVLATVTLIVTVSALRPEGSLGEKSYKKIKKWYKGVKRRQGNGRSGADDVEEGIENPDGTTNQTSLSPSNSRPPLSHSSILSPTISCSETLSSAQPHGPKDNTAINQTIPSPSDFQSPLTQSSSQPATITLSETPPSPQSQVPEKSSPLSGSGPSLFRPDTQSTVIQPVELRPLSRFHTPEEDTEASQKVASLSGSEPFLLRSDTQFTAVPPSESLPSSQSRTPNAPRVTPDICPEPRIEGSIEFSSLPSFVALPLPDETVNVNLQRPTTGYQGGRVVMRGVE